LLLYWISCRNGSAIFMCFRLYWCEQAIKVCLNTWKFSLNTSEVCLDTCGEFKELLMIFFRMSLECLDIKLERAHLKTQELLRPLNPKVQPVRICV
jgi:hypothetical protein